MCEDDFQVVRKRGWKKKKAHEAMQTFHLAVHDDHDTFEMQTFIKRLNSCIQDVLLSEFFSQTLDMIISALLNLIKENAARREGDSAPWKASGEPELLVDRALKGTAATESTTVHPKLSSTSSDSKNVRYDLECSNQSLTAHSGSSVEAKPLCTTSPHSPTYNDVSPECSNNCDDLARVNVHFLSYGIGNFISCPIARYQLAFFIAVRNKIWRCTESSCSSLVYDPVFTSNERAVLKHLNCTVLEHNEEGKRECQAPTVAFLPHCGKALYNNLLWKNLSTANGLNLSNLILVGNSFTRMMESTPLRQLRKTANFIVELLPYLTEVGLPNTFIHEDVFNDLALHTFPMSRTQALSKTFWENFSEPVYDDADVEFIRKNKDKLC